MTIGKRILIHFYGFQYLRDCNSINVVGISMVLIRVCIDIDYIISIYIQKYIVLSLKYYISLVEINSAAVSIHILQHAGNHKSRVGSDDNGSGDVRNIYDHYNLGYYRCIAEISSCMNGLICIYMLQCLKDRKYLIEHDILQIDLMGIYTLWNSIHYKGKARVIKIYIL